MAVAKRFGNGKDGNQIESKKEDKPVVPTSAAKSPPPKAKAVVRTVDNSKSLAAVKAAIFKTTQTKPVEIVKTTQPHVPTGSFLIDHLIGGTLAEDGKGPVCPGYPKRRITEIYGSEASGKTTAALEAIAAVQRAGGWALFLDFEHALNQRYARRIGVDMENNLLHYEPNSMEEGWKQLFVAIRGGADLVVIDSVAAMVPKSELGKKLDEPATIGARARALSDMLPKVITWLSDKEISPKGTALILINQTRSMIGGNSRGGTDDNTSGGKALKFYDYLRIKFTKVGSERIKRKDPMSGKEKYYPYGNHTQVKMVKSKIDGVEGHTVNIFIRFNHGIDNYHSLIEAAVVNKIAKKAGSMYAYGEHNFRGRDPFREFLIQNPRVFEEIKTKVLNAVRDNVEIEDLDESDELLEGLPFDNDEDSSSVEEVEASVDAEDLEAAVGLSAEV